MIIVSLTIIKARLGGLPKVIDSLCNQTRKPDIIHVFYSTTPLLIDDGITADEIDAICHHYCQTSPPHPKVYTTEHPNIGPYRKILPALELYGHSQPVDTPNIIITVDDDHEYSPTFIAQFMETYEKYGCIVCSAAKRANLKATTATTTDNTIGPITLPYVDPTTMPMLHLIPEGFGGILYDTNMWQFACPVMNAEDVICKDVVTLTNDDIFLRLCTFKQGIRVMLINTGKTIIEAVHPQKGLYNNYNHVMTTSQIVAHINQTPFMTGLHTLYSTTIDNIIDMIDEVYTARELTNIRHSFKMGTDIKLLQYERNVGAQNSAAIDFIQLLTSILTENAPHSLSVLHGCVHLDTTLRVVTGKDTACVRMNINTTGNVGVLLINIEKDLKRYGSAVEELKKLTIPTFVHLKATYWRERDNFTKDLNNIVDYLQMYHNNDNLYSHGCVHLDTTLRVVIGKDTACVRMNNNKGNKPPITFDAFSAPTDPNIHIQDGPLACYCSHLRAMIYAQTYGLDAAIICEDDLLVANTHKIAEYVAQIPDDWDVITFNSVPIGIEYGSAPWYRMQGRFYSTHFYIVRRRALPTIFQHMYPITDQVDILLSKLYDQLAIYNIIDTIYQKNYSTNTQNNLWVIYNSAGYEPIRAQLRELGELYETYIEHTLECSPDAAKRVATNAIADVLFEYIMTNSSCLLMGGGGGGDGGAGTPNTTAPFKEAERIYELLHVIINCCVKGIGIHKVVLQLMGDIQNIIDCFRCTAVDQIPYAYGSTANVFIVDDGAAIIKQYNKDVRWATAPDSHRDADTIFRRELDILRRLDDPKRLLGWDTGDLALKLANMGESLYEHFVLPADWREQLREVFAVFTAKGIYYSEFNLKNIICSADGTQINLVDFGLCEIVGQGEEEGCIANKNAVACEAFIELLEMLAEKMYDEKDSLRAKILYKTFINNLRICPQDKYKAYIY